MRTKYSLNKTKSIPLDPTEDFTNVPRPIVAIISMFKKALGKTPGQYFSK
jgi:hypothetical protein